MKENPSQYGGLAAVFVFGIGLLIVGFSLPLDRHEQAVSMRWMGAFALAFGLVMLALSVFGSQISGPLILSVAAMVGSGYLIYSATRSEMTGKAVYHHKFLSRHGWRTEPVTRQEKPDMFREATNVRWALSIVCAAVGIGSFVFYRNTEYDDY